MLHGWWLDPVFGQTVIRGLLADGTPVGFDLWWRIHVRVGTLPASNGREGIYRLGQPDLVRWRAAFPNLIVGTDEVPDIQPPGMVETQPQAAAAHAVGAAERRPATPHGTRTR